MTEVPLVATSANKDPVSKANIVQYTFYYLNIEDLSVIVPFETSQEEIGSLLYVVHMS